MMRRTVFDGRGPNDGSQWATLCAGRATPIGPPARADAVHAARHATGLFSAGLQRGRMAAESASGPVSERRFRPYSAVIPQTFRRLLAVLGHLAAPPSSAVRPITA